MTRRASISFLTIITLAISAGSLFAMSTPPPRTHVPVRVLVMKASDEVKLRIKGFYKMVDFKTGGLLEEGRDFKEHRLSVRDGDFNSIKILSQRGSCIYVNDRQFRGDIDIMKNDAGKLMVVNHIDIEEYLYGVLYHEVSHRWPLEVLKAQAIAARTYALYQKLISEEGYYDLYSDTYSQVYGGRTSERRRTTKAVDLTRGLILTYEGKVFPAYYHATCGGHTSDAGTLWNIDMPPLKGVICDFCRISPHYRWEKEFSLSQIEKQLQESGYNIKVDSIEILKKDNAGRVLDIAVTGKGESLHLTGNKFRLAVGPNALRSANFDIATKGRYITFYGRGWGHGAGMCQWGAYEMSRRGWKAEEILEYYYPGAEIMKVE